MWKRNCLVVAIMAALVFGPALTSPAIASVSQGNTAPAFATQAVIAGKPFEFSLKEALTKGPVVLYFFPAAFTNGCTIEAHNFSEASDQFKAMGATIIGLSHDSLEKLKRFSVSECRNKFAVGVATNQIIAAYDVKLPIVAMSNRTTFVIGPNGKILLKYQSLSPNQHVAKALAAVKVWRSSH